jgi:putative oxidoreductase
MGRHVMPFRIFFVSSEIGWEDVMRSRLSNSLFLLSSFLNGMQPSDIGILLGRICLGLIFVHGGYDKLFDIPGYAAIFPPRGIPELTGYLSIPIEIVGGAALMLGLATRYAAGIMIVTLFAIISYDSYWDLNAIVPRSVPEETFYYKNLAILSGLYLIIACGGGRFSIDWLVARLQKGPRKAEVAVWTNESRRFYAVELVLPEKEFDKQLAVVDVFHANVGISPQMERGLRDTDRQCRDYMRWYFADPQHARSFQALFGDDVIKMPDNSD